MAGLRCSIVRCGRPHREDALKMLAAGALRIGASSSLAIVVD
jgi:hypothetical protein